MNYFHETKKFYYSFFFILPFLAIYELGLSQDILGKQLNGADALLRFIFYFVLSIVGIHLTKWIVGGMILLALGIFIYYLIQNRIKMRLTYFPFMLLESATLAFILAVAISLALSHSFPVFFGMEPNVSIQEQLRFNHLDTFWAKVVASTGAGIFEELVFRVFLIRFLFVIFAKKQNMDLQSDSSALFKSVGISTFVFTLMHFGSLGSSSGYFSIFFAGLLLSVIYITRGYGTAAISHALYDMFLMFGVIA